MISIGISARVIIVAVMIAANLFFTTGTKASEFEAPETYAPTDLLAEQAIGSNYRVDDPVRSDGLLRIYMLETPYGQYRVEGDFFLEMRLKELAAISALESAEDNGTFQSSLQQALKNPVDFVGDAIDDPGAAVERTLSGVGRFFDRAASAVRNRGKSTDNLAQSLLGVSRAKREIAVGLGVDPYTDFKPLADRLEKAAEVSAAGSLTVKGLFALIPGGVGLAVSTASTAGHVQDLVRDRTSAELRDINRSNLVRAVTEEPLIELFLDNPNYTPTDQTIIAEALFRLQLAKNLGGFLAHLTNISERSLAVFMRERVGLLALYHEQVSPLSEFISINGVPFSLTSNGKLIGVFPIDHLAWTERTARIINLITEGAASAFPSADIELLITGEATPLAGEKLRELGWTLIEKINYSSRNEE